MVRVPVTAADIQTDSEVEILNPETGNCPYLRVSGRLKIVYGKLTITKGRGYVSAEKTK
jgi:DNA-directed RNA polymerase subunit alpha